MQAHRLRAPQGDGAILAEPPLDRAADLLRRNLARLSAWRYDFQGRDHATLRERARAEAFEASRLYHESAGIDQPAAPDPSAPLVVTGHQPELFHPGVWVKNFAIAGLARRVGGAALNLIVDNDIPKGPTIRVPDRSTGRLRTRPVAFDEWPGEIPFEDQAIRDENLFASFPARVREILGTQVRHPLVDRFWGHVVSAPGGMPGRDRVGLRFARARRLVEGEAGVRNFEVPLSTLCETDGFRWFACHLLAQLPRFQAVHDASLARYRALYKIRSKNHPVAALARRGEWLEAPFWAWRATEPRRRPLMVRQRADAMDLRIGDEAEPFLELPLTADREACCAVEALRDLPGLGIRLRTRALTTTMFARFLVGDLFVHGIGGAKYDELGDEISRGFFGIVPPGFMTLSMTLRLGLPTSSATPGELHSVDRRLRDLAWQPERFLEDSADGLGHLLATKRRLIAEMPEGHSARLVRYRAFREVNAALAARVEAGRPAIESRRVDIVAALRDDAIARSRETSVVLFDETRIFGAMDGVTRTSGG